MLSEHDIVEIVEPTLPASIQDVQAEVNEAFSGGEDEDIFASPAANEAPLQTSAERQSTGVDETLDQAA